MPDTLNKKKVLFLIQLPPPIHGVSIINQLIKESGYIREHIDMDILPINTSKLLEEIDKVSFSKISRTMRVVFALFKRLLLKRYDLVYFTANLKGFAFCRDFIFVFIIRLFRFKRLYHLHGYGIMEELKAKPFLGRLYRYYFNKAKVITLGETIYKEDIAYFVKRKNNFILHNAIPRTLKDDIVESIIRNRKNKKTLNILFLSNMMESKGPLLLLKSLKTLKEKAYDFKACFAGGWMLEEFRNLFENSLRKYELNNYVEIKGFCSGEKKSRAFAEADIFAFPTLRDTWALVILEAMEYALPVISTKEGAIPEIVSDGKNGFVIPKNNIEAITEKLELLINDKGLRLEMGRHGREDFIREYSFDKYEKRLAGIFNRV